MGEHNQGIPIIRAIISIFKKSSSPLIVPLIRHQTHAYRDVATEWWGGWEGRGEHIPPLPPLQFLSPKRSHSFSFKHQKYCFLRVLLNYMDQKFHYFHRACYKFWTIYSDFSYFLTTQVKQITSRWTFSKGLILKAGPSENFLIMDYLKDDHNE